MADDRSKLYEETLQVRIRSKNPLIERRPTDRVDSDATVAENGDAEPKKTRPSEGRSIYEQIEHSDRTEELAPKVTKEPMPVEDTKSMVFEPRVKVAPVPTVAKKEPRKRAEPILPSPPKPRSSFLDEDETLVAVGPPQRVGDLEREHQHPTFSEVDGLVPTLVPAPSNVPTERPGAVVVRRSVPKTGEPEPPLEDLAVVPRRYLGAPGTHGAGAEFHRQMVDWIDRELPEVNAIPLKMLRSELSAELLHSLENILAGHHEQPASDGSISPKRALEHLINERSYHSLIPADRARLLMPVAREPNDISTIKSGIAILKTRLIERLGEHLRSKLLDLFGRLDPDARATLAQLAARQLRNRSVLEDTDLRQVSLIERMYQLVNGPSVPELLELHGIRRDRVVKLVLASLANPAKLSFEEGSPGVLSAIEFALADTSPAEYTRLWYEIVGSTCTAQLAGGAELDLTSLSDDFSFTSQMTPLRTALDQLPGLSHSRRKANADFLMAGGHGIDADVLSRALTLVYGMGYTVAAGLDTASRQLARIAADPHRAPPVFASLLYDRGERLFVFDHFEEESVFLRAPHGRSSRRTGAFRADPRRAVVDQDTGLESMPLADFQQWIGVALVPRHQ